MQLNKLAVQSYILYYPSFMDRLDAEKVTLERRGQREGTDKWGIFCSNRVLSEKDKDFVYEGMHSSRTDKDYENTRFTTAEEALKFWKELEPSYEKGLKDLINNFKIIQEKCKAEKINK